MLGHHMSYKGIMSFNLVSHDHHRSSLGPLSPEPNPIRMIRLRKLSLRRVFSAYGGPMRLNVIMTEDTFTGHGGYPGMRLASPAI